MALFALCGASCDPAFIILLGAPYPHAAGRAQGVKNLNAAMTATIPAKINRAGTGLRANGWVEPRATDEGDKGLRGF